MKTHILRGTAACLAVGTPLIAWAAFSPGGVAYTKRLETALLAEPKPLAESVARLGYAKRLKVEEVRGRWLRVSEGASAGWVFSGNLAEEKPAENRGLDGLPIAASETSATSAARPLAPAAADYGARRGLADARSDIEWLERTSDALDAAKVQAFLQEQKKGEYQP